jgi:hypothetical protein
MVPETQHGVAISHQPSVTALIAGITVLTAITFDDEFVFGAYEVSDIRADRLLAFEFQVHETACAQVIPEFQFGIGLFGS